MPKFITLVITLVLISCAIPMVSIAQESSPPPTTETQKPTPRSDEIKLQENAPSRYVVVRGDTLWDISAKFLKDPWRWPEIWRMNKDEIRNPHWIYPGNVVVLDWEGGKPRLRLLDGTVKLSPEESKGTPDRLSESGILRLGPQVRMQALAAAGIPSIPVSIIAPFLTDPLIIEEEILNTAPKIIAVEENRIKASSGDTIYVAGIEKNDPRSWHIYRPLKRLIDPDTKKYLGFEALYLGSARTVKHDYPAIVQIVASPQEIEVGDRLIAAGKPLLINYAPHAPQEFIRGRVMGVFQGITDASNYAIITINRGKREGIEVGHVLALYRAGAASRNIDGGDRIESILKSETEKIRETRIPEERYGLVFVFRVFEKVSYALVMNISRPVIKLDYVQTP